MSACFASPRDYLEALWATPGCLTPNAITRWCDEPERTRALYGKPREGWKDHPHGKPREGWKDHPHGLWSYHGGPATDGMREMSAAHKRRLGACIRRGEKSLRAKGHEKARLWPLEESKALWSYLNEPFRH